MKRSNESLTQHGMRTLGDRESQRGSARARHHFSQSQEFQLTDFARARLQKDSLGNDERDCRAAAGMSPNRTSHSSFASFGARSDASGFSGKDVTARQVARLEKALNAEIKRRQEVTKTLEDLEAELKRTRSAPRWAAEEEQAARKAKAATAKLRWEAEKTAEDLAEAQKLIEKQAKEIEKLEAVAEKQHEWAEERNQLLSANVKLLHKERCVTREPDFQSRAQVLALEAEAEGLRRCLHTRAEQAWKMSERMSELEAEVEQARSVQSEYWEQKKGLLNQKSRFESSMKSFCDALARATDDVPIIQKRNSAHSVSK